MEVFLTVNRGFLGDTRPKFFYFSVFEVFPRLRTNAHYPDAAAKIAALEVLNGDYSGAHSAKNTSLADEIYQNILTGSSLLAKYVEDNCGNNLARLEESGFTANKTHGTPEPLTGKVTNVNSMTLGERKVKFEYASDNYAHYFLARERKKGGTDADWVMNGRSENHTMILTSTLNHGDDVETQICGNGTKGQGNWSDSKFYLLD